MTGDDLKHLQDGFLLTAQHILREDGQLRPVGSVVTLRKHLDQLFDSGWGVEFLDPAAVLRADQGDETAVLIIDLVMDWERLYHATLNVIPQAQRILPPMIAMGKAAGIDHVYMHALRPFFAETGIHAKDIIMGTLRQICGKVDAYACVMQSEAWMRRMDPATESLDEIYKNAPGGLGQDAKSVEIIVSVMETYDFTRTVTVPILRTPSNARDEGEIQGFGEPSEMLAAPNAVKGRMSGFLKPLKEAS